MTTIASRGSAEHIRLLNDNFRSTFIGGRIVVTAGVRIPTLDINARVLLAVRSFCNFTKDNDPHREHDFGNFEIEGETYFWKIDYDPEMRFGSEDPPTPRRRRACSPSCAPTSTDLPTQPKRRRAMSAQQPSYRAYTVIKREGQDDFWLAIGAAFMHQDGDGYNIVLQALPIDGKIVLRLPKGEDNQQQPAKDNVRPIKNRRERTGAS